MRPSLFRFFVALGICVSVALAQQSEKKAAPKLATRSDQQSSPSQTTGMSAPQPAHEIQTLTKALAGRWSTREKYEPGEPTPNGGVGQGETLWRPGPGGFTLLEEYHSQTPIGELFGFGLVWWDETKGLQHMWCMNLYPTGCEMFPGPPLPGPKWDGKQLVVDTESEIAGKKFVWHEVISDITPTSFTQTADIGESGGALKRWFTIHATKITDARLPSTPSKSKHQ
jgi:hypothetical protein